MVGLDPADCTDGVGVAEAEGEGVAEGVGGAGAWKVNVPAFQETEDGLLAVTPPKRFETAVTFSVPAATAGVRTVKVFPELDIPVPNWEPKETETGWKFGPSTGLVRGDVKVPSPT